MSIDQLRIEGDSDKAEEHNRVRERFNTIVTQCVSGKSLEDVLKEIKTQELDRTPGVGQEVSL